jgi:chromate transporter
MPSGVRSTRPTSMRTNDIPSHPPIARATLFSAFLKIGLLGFGGVMPWARRVLVEERRWLTDREFAELIGMCQVLPGPNVVNLSVILGARWQGPIGSLLALTGILFVPVIAVVLLATFYASVAHAPIARSAIAGASAAAAGLIIGTAIRLIRASRPPPRAIALAAAVFVAVGVVQAPLLWVLAIAVPLAIAVEWRAPR